MLLHTTVFILEFYDTYRYPNPAKLKKIRSFHGSDFIFMRNEGTC